MTDKGIKAVLIDVGGPLVDDSGIDQVWNNTFLKVLPEYIGREVSPEELAEVYKKVITAYAPSIFSAAIWHFVRPDVRAFRELRNVLDGLEFHRYYKFRPEAIEVCADLSEKFKLAIAANQPESTRQYLNREGLLKYFTFCEMSGETPYSKPDLRFFLYISNKIGIPPEQCVMVGDRQDNDIVPAKLLGMKTIRFKTGLHRNQEVRMPSELPDKIINSLNELPGAINALQIGADNI